MYFTALYIIYTVGFLISCACVAAVMGQKTSGQQKIMAGMTFFIAVMWLGSWLGIHSQTLGEMNICTKITFTGSCHVFLFQLMLMFSYCRVQPPKVLYPMLCGVNCIINIVAFSIGRDGLFFASEELRQYGGFSMLITASGPFHQLYLAMEVFYSIIMLITAVISVIHDSDRLVPVGGFTFAVLIPTACSLLYANSYTEMDFTPVGFLVSEIIIFLLIYGSKIYDVQDTARQYVFDSLEDGIIVLDRHQRLKGYNEIAKQIFPELRYSKPDTPIDDASPDINKILYEKAAKDIEVGSRVYRPSITKITDDKDKKHINGYVIRATDVTEQQRNLELINNYQRNLERDVREKTARILKMQEQTIFSFATLVESRDSLTGEHVRRTSDYVAVLAAEMKKRGMYPRVITASYLEQLRMAAPLHDIGKIKIPDSILKNPGKLSPEEFEIMKSHTVEGGKIIEDTLKEIEGDNFFLIAKEVAVYHHEKWNGTGYPYGTKGEEIPISARIMAVADFFDALTSARSYKKAYSASKAYQILMEESGKSFDPRVVDCFMRSRGEIEKILVKYGGSLEAEDDVLSDRDKAMSRLRNGF
ncbi:MAG: HD domain-containing protein [Oscillospiraceae bacterium]|nr:HD domain-containing protein [Oscillospiraceae bacterium]